MPPGAFTRVEVDLRHQQVAQRVQVERVELVGRERAARSPPSSDSPASGRGCSARSSGPTRSAAPARSAPRRSPPSRTPPSAARAPSRPPRANPAASTTAFIAPGARAARLDDLDPLVLEQPVEHPPGQRPMRPAALQRQVQRLRRRNAPWILPPRPPRRRRSDSGCMRALRQGAVPRARARRTRPWRASTSCGRGAPRDLKCRPSPASAPARSRRSRCAALLGAARGSVRRSARGRRRSASVADVASRRRRSSHRLHRRSARQAVAP